MSENSFDTSQKETEQKPAGLPDWLLSHDAYTPPADRDPAATRSVLSIMGVLRHFRWETAPAKYAAFTKIEPSAPVKLVLLIGLILLNSLSSNFSFTLFLIAVTLVFEACMPAKQLRKTIVAALGSAALAGVIMVPAFLLGQYQSALLIASKTFVSVSAVFIMATTTPFNQLTAALRVFHVPNLFIMTLDMALKNIVRLGDTALSVLQALQLRSVGHNSQKMTSMGGVSGVLLLKSNEAATHTYEAMECRGFSGDYTALHKVTFKAADLIWTVLFALVIALFVYLEGAL